ncbi:MAG: hypothetical protein PHR35_19875 [Kiritimatiellae bacterium]|nr:hypothetical protein [Kiritimatiellia bacterium]
MNQTQTTETTHVYEDESVKEAMQALRYTPGAAEEAQARFYRALGWLRRARYRHGAVEMTTTLASGETFHNHTAFGLLSLVLAGEPVAEVELVHRSSGPHALAMPVPAPVPSLA